MVPDDKNRRGVRRELCGRLPEPERRRCARDRRRRHRTRAWVLRRQRTAMADRQSVERGDFELSHETVKTYADDEYKKVRERWQLGDDFLGGFDFAELKEGGGKGGNLMGFTKDKQYLARVRRDRVKIRARRVSAHVDPQVKEVNATDHNTILRIIHKYVAHLLDPEGSLLARFFLHFERGGKNYLVMNNWMPPPRYTEVDGKELGHDIKLNYSTYDLKGCADDKTLKVHGADVEAVHKRVFNVAMWLGTLFWSPERKHYYEGKLHARETQFPVSVAAHAEIVRKTARDVRLLQACGLMDYSLVVSFHAMPRSQLALAESVYKGTADGGDQPFICSKPKQVFICYVGIIDFLQDWTAAKVVANCVKFLECNKATIPPKPYGDRFLNFVEGKFVPECE